jgi:hypothetical protein
MFKLRLVFRWRLQVHAHKFDQDLLEVHAGAGGDKEETQKNAAERTNVRLDLPDQGCMISTLRVHVYVSVSLTATCACAVRWLMTTLCIVPECVGNGNFWVYGNCCMGDEGRCPWCIHNEKSAHVLTCNHASTIHLMPTRRPCYPCQHHSCAHLITVVCLREQNACDEGAQRIRQPDHFCERARRGHCKQTQGYKGFAAPGPGNRAKNNRERGVAEQQQRSEATEGASEHLEQLCGACRLRASYVGVVMLV